MARARVSYRPPSSCSWRANISRSYATVRRRRWTEPRANPSPNPKDKIAPIDPELIRPTPNAKLTAEDPASTNQFQRQLFMGSVCGRCPRTRGREHRRARRAGPHSSAVFVLTRGIGYRDSYWRRASTNAWACRSDGRGARSSFAMSSKPALVRVTMTSSVRCRNARRSTSCPYGLSNRRSPTPAW